MPELITVPTFTFNQGDVFNEVINVERPIQVCYYSNAISLEQDGESILIVPEYFEALVKEIRKHLPEANKALKK